MAEIPVIDQMIKKYSKGDDAYEQKLRTNIRDAFGYSNHMSNLSRELGQPADIGSVKGLSPAGINSRIQTRFGMQDENIRTEGEVAGAIDSQASILAKQQVAREKSARAAGEGKYGINNGVMFNPTNPVESRLSEYMKNPMNPDGTTKSLQQMEAELNENFGIQEGYSPEDIKKIIQTRVPSDFIGNETLYQAMAQGYSRKQASDPSTAGAVRDAMQTVTTKVVDPNTGQEVAEILPKFTLDEIKNRYPDLTDAEAISIVKPAEQRAMVDDIRKDRFLNPQNIASFLEANGGKENPARAYATLMKDENYTALKTMLTLEYPNFTAAEVDGLLYQYVRSIQ